MIDPRMWERHLLDLHTRHTEDCDDDELSVTFAERHAVFDFMRSLHRFDPPEDP